MAKATSSHRWRFFRAGGVDQVRLDTGADIQNLEHLDKKLWVALSCPVKGLEFDERTLSFLDTDGDGRVRAPEVLSAIRWTTGLIKSADDLVKEVDGLPLAAIDTSGAEGQAILKGAEMILSTLGKPEAKSITVAEAMNSAKTMSEARLNGDGIVPPETVEDEEGRQVAQEIVDCLGGALDRSGKPGLDAERVSAFFDELMDFEAWWKEGQDQKDAMPLGDETPAAYGALQAARVKVDDYFARCRVAAFDGRAAALLGGEEKLYTELSAQALSAAVGEVAHLPLQQVAADRPLDLATGVNPAWSAAIDDLTKRVVRPVLGKDVKSLTEAQWRELTGSFTGHEAWLAKKKGAAVAGLGVARVRAILSGKSRKALKQAIAEDESVKAEAEAIDDVERLARCYRDLHHLLVNFVSFEDFYSRRRKAVFQAGTLYLDGRSCDLCVHVTDAAKHGLLAGMAKTYLAYCTCTRPSGESMTIAAAFTAGDSDHLIVGRNGIFFDRSGRDWDATITKIVDNPMSIPQAFWAPYKRFLRWIEEQVAKRAAAADEASTGKLTAAATSAEATATTGKAPDKPKFDVGVVAALGVGVGAITAAMGGLLQAFFGLGMWMPIGVVGLVLLISGPSMLIAWLKLRQRNLGPILDANGWAVNGRTKVNIPLGASLTDRATIPAGSERSLVDPFAEKKRLWPRVLVFLVVLGLVGWGLYEAKVQPVKRWIDQGIHAVYPEWPVAIEGESLRTVDPGSKTAEPAPAEPK